MLFFDVEGLYVDLHEGSDHYEAKNIQKPEDEQKVVSQKAVSGPPSGKNANGEQDGSTSPCKSKVEHGDSEPSAMKPGNYV